MTLKIIGVIALIAWAILIKWIINNWRESNKIKKILKDNNLED